MALLSGSPAIDAGDNTDAPQFDQRGPGFPRIVGILNPAVPVIDLGAFEVQNGSQPGSSNNQDFVAQVYRDLLNREADPGGLASFTSLLDQGLVNRSQVVLAIESNLEYRSDVVVDFYSQFLHRDHGKQGMGSGETVGDRKGSVVDVRGVAGTLPQTAMILAWFQVDKFAWLG